MKWYTQKTGSEDVCHYTKNCCQADYGKYKLDIPQTIDTSCHCESKAWIAKQAKRGQTQSAEMKLQTFSSAVNGIVDQSRSEPKWTNMERAQCFENP